MYIRAFTEKNLRIHLHIFQDWPHIPYALLLKPTLVYTHFLCHKPAYISTNIIGLQTLQNSSDITLHFNKDSPNHRSKHSINRSRKYIVISNLEIPLHHFLHRCIINSDQWIKCYPFHADILQSEVCIKTQTYAYTCSMIFFSLYRFSLCQYHESKPLNRWWYSWTGSNR